MLALGIICACVGALLAARRSDDAVTVSQVRRQVIANTLQRGQTPTEPDGALLGPWRITAEDADPVTGRLHLLRLENDDMVLTARSAALTIDETRDTVSLHLHNLELATLKDATEDGVVDRFLNHLEAFTVGPIPWRMPIVADGDIAAQSH